MVAVGHTNQVISYHALQNNESYQELEGNYFDQRVRQAIEKRLVRRLEQLGCEVS